MKALHFNTKQVNSRVTAISDNDEGLCPHCQDLELYKLLYHDLVTRLELRDGMSDANAQPEDERTPNGEHLAASMVLAERLNRTKDRP
jgi:hypothetical protein